MIDSLAQAYGVEANKVQAVLTVESKGHAFTDGRLTIRFEPHIFFAETSSNLAHEFFAIIGNPLWRPENHRMRASEADVWRPMHGNQDAEWEAVTLASVIDTQAAWQACSMGAPQIMGFHYRMLGYESPQAMTLDFMWNEHNQYSAMFRWMDSTGALQALRDSNYLRFATIYNGSGQAEYYAEKIKAAL